MPERSPLRIVPLGGLGEFGLNCLVLERGDDAIVVDCGVMFPEDHMMGIDRVIPDVSYLHSLGERLKAFVLTHGHEDHIGALPYVLPSLGVPVFATPFTAALLDRKLAEYPDAAGSRVEIYQAGDRWQLGGFEVEALRVTHSIVDSCALAIRSEGNLVVHTGDFKLDAAPVDGRCSDLERLARLGREGVDLLLSDSTNVDRPGSGESESEVRGYLSRFFPETSGRLFITTFASHIHRIAAVVSLCEQFGRRLTIVGRSMEETTALATRTGHLRIPGEMLASMRQLRGLDSRQSCVLVTGSQGEPGSALSRIATLSQVELQPVSGDTVVFSSKVIPGNEKAISALINRLLRCGAEVYYAGIAPVHVSGHACRDELRRMIELLRPRYFVPVHGEYRNLLHHSRLATASGVEKQHCVCLVDGEVLEIDERGARKVGNVPAGRVLVDGAGVGDVDDTVLRDRRHISADGVVVVILALSRQTGTILAGPDIVARGLATSEEGGDDFTELKRKLLAELGAMSPAAAADLAEVQELVRRVARRHLRKKLGRRPVVVPYVIEL